ncbi:hypothetical protein ACFFRR_008004 [Megaselia abdita]
MTNFLECLTFRRNGYQPIGFQRSLFGIRHLQCFLLFLCLTVAYALRVNLSVAIVAMTNANSTNPDFPEYTWNEKTKSLLLSSFFWGYIITQIPGGAIAQKYGAKYCLLIGLLLCSLMAILTPYFAAIGDWPLVCALRVVQGLCQGVLFPSVHTLISKWAPVDERGKLGTYTYSGTQFGTVLMLGSSGVIASSSAGWPGIFYISGAVGVLWSIVWYFYGASTPAESKSISVEERKFIETSIGSTPNTVKPKTPWLAIFTSIPFYSLIFVHCAHNWGFWTLLTEIPTYMANILKKDIKSNAVLSALPYFVMCLLCYVFSFIADLLFKRGLSLSTSRKVFNTIGQWGPAVALIGLGYTTDATLAIVLLTITVGINSATYLGFQMNHIDLSPNFAGTLMGITNCAANVMSIIAPLVVGFIVTDEENAFQWRIVFFISAAFFFTGNLLFCLFGKTEVQPWNNGPVSRRQSTREAENGTARNGPVEST